MGQLTVHNTSHVQVVDCDFSHGLQTGLVVGTVVTHVPADAGVARHVQKPTCSWWWW